jgi:C-terminal processing protease CtpA/Prc
MAAFATRLQELIRAIDQPPACGWIVDLRQDEGGNLWPMLAGVGPLLGEGEVGAFVTSGQRVPWVYRDGGAYVGTQVVTVVNNPYRRADPPPVAVLTAAQTASSGELLVVAFRGRPSTRSFGSPTRGVPTSNEPKVLADGAVLLLTTTASADRTGATYEDTIQPDQRVAGVTLTRGDEATDPTVQAAAMWLRAQPGCVPAA